MTGVPSGGDATRSAETAQQAPLDVVVVTYGAATLVRRCLDSVIAHAPTGTRVFVVDNASPDGTADIVSEEFPQVELIRRSSNDGFAVANNVALRRSSAPYVLVLNPDAELEAGTLDHLLREMRQHPTVGVMGCRLLTADGALDHAAKRMIPSPGDAIRWFLPGRSAGRSRYTAPAVDERGAGPVDAVNGAFMLIRRAALEEVGLLDEAYWMYAEDLDWCVRFRKAGWSVRYDGRVVAHHLKAGSSGKARSWRLNYHFHRSMDIFYRAHSATGNALFDGIVRCGIWARFLLVATTDQARRAAAKRPGAPARG